MNLGAPSVTKWLGLLVGVWFLGVAFMPTAHATSEVGTYDTIHLIPPIYAKDGIGTTSNVQHHYLYLSTAETTPFNVTIQNTDGYNGVIGGISETVTISKASPQLVTLSGGVYGGIGYAATGIVTDADINSVDTTEGLILTAPSRFYANIRHLSGSQGTSLTAKGQTAMGQRFRSGHLHTNQNETSQKSHFISVMATEDGTTVNFSDISPGITFVGGSTAPAPVVLNKYQSYVIGMRLDQFLNTAGTVENDLNGTLVTADRPIVMNSGSYLAGAEASGRDIGSDQILPTGFLGTKFIVVEGGGGAAADELETPIVVADTDGTEIYLKGSSTVFDTIDAGEYSIIPGTEYPAAGAMFIRTSEPAYVYQSTSSNASNGNGMNYVAPIFDNLEVQPVLIPAVNQLGTPILSVIAPATATITLDGSNMTGATAVPGIGEFVLYTDTDETGDVEITGTEPFLVTTTSNSGARGAAGYFVGFPNSYAIQDKAATPPGTPVTIDVQLNDVTGVFTFDVTSITQPANGVTVLNGDDTITYTPNSPAFVGVDTFTYTIDNGGGVTDTAIVTVAIDSDGDGIGNIDDLDDDNDGIPDSVEGLIDTDGDGITNELDLDSDNDGIYDLEEARHGAVDANNDGRIDSFAGDNGLADVVETVAESDTLNYTVNNLDGDTVFSFLDLDSDNDGLPDNIEAQDGASYTAPGLSYNGDGLDTLYPTGLQPYNTSGAGNPDYLNTDSDGDGDNDTLEAGLTLSNVPGANGLDSNYETLDDYSDPNGTVGDPSTFPDSDGDGTPDYQDDNEPPTDLTIDGANSDTVDENQPVGTTIGAFATTDPNPGDLFTYSLTCAVAGADDALFQVNGATLETAAIFDFEVPTDGNTDGNYEVCVVSNDGFHDYEETITIGVSNLDDTPPNDPAAGPDLRPGSDSGASDTDNETNDLTPSFDVVCTEIGSTITLYTDNPVVDTVAATHTCTAVATEVITPSSNLNTGTHNFTYTETDTSANESGKSPSLAVEIDNNLPAAPTVDSPNGGGTTTGVVSGSGGNAGDTVTVTVQGTGETCTATVQGDGSWSCTLAPTPFPGAVSIDVIATDTAGNDSPTTVVNANIDGTDTDGDGIADVIEKAICTTYPAIASCTGATPELGIQPSTDTDGDGIPDAIEYKDGTDPNRR